MKEEKYVHPVPDHDNTHQGDGVLRYLRDEPPAHYSLMIDSFSKFVDLFDEGYESDRFSTSGYTWRLVLYPNGNAERGGEGHVSLYLAIDDTDSLPVSYEARVTIKMFVYNHDKDKYLTIQDDARHQIRRFHKAKKENGFHRLISLDILKDATNGYLIDDSCIFGVEVYDVKHSGDGEVLETIDNPVQHTFNWKVGKFSRISEFLSEEYTTDGDHKWRIRLYPKGQSGAKDCLALYLELVKSPSTCKRVLADFSLVIKNQISSSDHHNWEGGDSWFSTASEFISDDVSRSWGDTRFMLLSELNSVPSGFIVKDSMIVEAKVTIKAEVTAFS